MYFIKYYFKYLAPKMVQVYEKESLGTSALNDIEVCYISSAWK